MIAFGALLSFSMQMLVQYFKLRHDRFLPRHLQFIIESSSFHIKSELLKASLSIHIYLFFLWVPFLSEAIHFVLTQNFNTTLTNSTNTTVPQVVELLPLILLEFLNRSSWNLYVRVMPCEVISMAYVIHLSHQ
jgi:hypothetical protein